MKIVYLITGSGNSFYCANCYRDMLYLRALRKVKGVKANAIPMYLPPGPEEVLNGYDSEVFFGAISMFLRDKVGFFRNMPSFFDKILDSGPLLKIASRMAGSTRSRGYEELTLDMIGGGKAFRDEEVDRLVKHLQEGGKPDIIHLSNALIAGIAKHIKKRMDVKIVCSILNEDDWIEEMEDPYREKAWKMIAAEGKNIDGFVTPSNYYMQFFISKTGIPDNKIHIIPMGYEPDYSPKKEKDIHPPSIGFFNRVSYNNGFDKIVDSFINLKVKNLIPDLTLNVGGGYTNDDRPFILSQIKKIKEHGFKKHVRIFPDFMGNKKREFFNSVDIISVPVNKYDGYGLYILEANYAGIPVVQPATGAFPEILNATGGGIIYSPDTVEELSSGLLSLLTDPKKAHEMGERGKEQVRSELSLDNMAGNLSAFYNQLFL